MREAASFIARQSAPDTSGLIADVIKAVQQFARSWHNRRKVMALSDFDDHMLADIGLCREDIRDALNLPFVQDPAIELQRSALRNRSKGWNA